MNYDSTCVGELMSVISTSLLILTMTIVFIAKARGVRRDISRRLSVGKQEKLRGIISKNREKTKLNRFDQLMLIVLFTSVLGYLLHLLYRNYKLFTVIEMTKYTSTVIQKLPGVIVFIVLVLIITFVLTELHLRQGKERIKP